MLVAVFPALLSCSMVGPVPEVEVEVEVDAVVMAVTRLSSETLISRQRHPSGISSFIYFFKFFMKWCAMK